MQLAQLVAADLGRSRRTLSTVESCTGGWIAKALTDLRGSSAWYLGGVIVYSNALKQSLVDVGAQTLARHGSVSEATAREMAHGMMKYGADITIAVTGVAGPDGGSPAKPVGTVWLAWAWRELSGDISVHAELEHFTGDREAVRRQTVQRALTEVLSLDRRRQP
jgi:nicotinamide-nucleotide amidase